MPLLPTKRIKNKKINIILTIGKKNVFQICVIFKTSPIFISLL